MFRIAKPVLAAALIALSGVPAFAADYVEPPVVEAPPAVGFRRLVHSRRPRLSLGGFPRRRLHHLRRDLLRPAGPGSTASTRRPRRRLLARRRRRLPDHQLPAHRPDRRLLVRLGFQRLDLGHLRRRPASRPTLRPGAPGCCSPTPMPISAPTTASRPMSAPVSAARTSTGTTSTTRSPASPPCTKAPTNWRFAWALMAGTSYCLTDNLKLDVGYRYSHINGGRMFELAPAAPAAPAPASTTASTCMRRAPAFATSSAATTGAACRRSPTSRRQPVYK